MMNTNPKQQPMTYEAPLVEVITVEVEQGFAGSTTIGGNAESGGAMGGGGNVGVEW